VSDIRALSRVPVPVPTCVFGCLTCDLCNDTNVLDMVEGLISRVRTADSKLRIDLLAHNFVRIASVHRSV